MPDGYWANALFSVIPTLLFGALFWFIFRAIVRADRSERKVYARIEAEERAKRSATQVPVSTSPPSVE